MLRKTVAEILSGTTWHMAFKESTGFRFLINEYGNLKVRFPVQIKSISYYDLHKRAQQGQQLHICQDGMYYLLPEMNPFEDALCVVMSYSALLKLPIVEVFEYRQAPFEEVISLTSAAILDYHFDKFNIFCSNGTVVKDISEIYSTNEYIAISKQTLSSDGNFHIVMRYIPASKICNLDNYYYKRKSSFF